MSNVDITAREAGLFGCGECGLVSRPERGATTGNCPRCGAHLHLRKPESIAATWAFLIAAYALYIPANVLPIMDTNSLFDVQQDTILSGAIYLWTTGSWAVALLVIIASIIEPLLKLFVLTFLVLSVQRRSTWNPRFRSRMYRLVDVVGRWSMLDVFVLTILVALVQIQSLAEIRAGAGALAFGAVVVLTMLASGSFDPRLLWDEARPHHD
ncbi:MAG: paraquat-inducible protein A [Betaproteobacteria bacterium]